MAAYFCHVVVPSLIVLALPFHLFTLWSALPIFTLRVSSASCRWGTKAGSSIDDCGSGLSIFFLAMPHWFYFHYPVTPSPFFNEGMEAFFNAPKLIYIRHWHYAASMLIPVMSFRDRRDDDDNWTFLSVTRQRRTCYNPPTAEVNNRLLYTCALSLFFTWFLCSACAAEHWWRQRSIFITIESITINSHLLLIRDNKSVCQQMHRGRVESLEQQQPLAHMTQCRLITCWCCCVLSSADGTLNMFQWCMSFSD